MKAFMKQSMLVTKGIGSEPLPKRAKVDSGPSKKQDIPVKPKANGKNAKTAKISDAKMTDPTQEIQSQVLLLIFALKYNRRSRKNLMQKLAMKLMIDWRFGLRCLFSHVT
jgi:hypothetical protein